MTRTQRSSTAARTRGLIQSETLENRRLFAGMPYGDHDFGPTHGPHGGFGAEVQVLVITLPLGGRMQMFSDGTSTTAASTLSNAANTTSTSSQPSTTAAVASSSTSAASSARVAAAINIEHSSNATNIAPSNDGAPLVAQVMADNAGRATALAHAATESATLAVAGINEPVFGPFVLGSVNTSTKSTDGGVASLLTLNPDSVDRSLRWQSQDASYRARRAASPVANTEAEQVDLARAASRATTEQAGLAPVAVEISNRPMWQRVAALAAGGLLVAANTIVRRRNRKLAVAARR